MTWPPDVWVDAPSTATPLDATNLNARQADIATEIARVEAAAPLKSRLFINVKDAPYSATGNGSTDDTAAIQAAITAANAAGGGEVFLPRGIYVCGSSLTLYSSVKLTGEGVKSSLRYTGSGTFITLTSSLRGCKFRTLDITLTHATGTALSLDNSFRHSFVSCQFTGQHTSASGTTYRTMTCVEFRNNAGDNRFVDCDINNYGTAVKTSSAMNYFTGCVFGTNYRGVWGDTGTDTAGISLNGCTFNGGATSVTRHLLCEVQANRWWISNCWFEGADVAWEIGKAAVGGPVVFAAVNCMVAATTRDIDVVYARQTSLINIHLSQDSGATTCDPLRINATDAIDGVAINISNVTTVGGFELSQTVFPSRWHYIGRTKMTLLPETWGTLDLNGKEIIRPQADGDTPFVVEGRSTTTVNLWEMKRGGTLYHYGDRFGSLFSIGNIQVTAAGAGLRVKEGSNAKQGTAVLVAGSVVVSNTAVTATSRIFLTSQVDGGTPGFVRVSARTAATSFTITSSSATDTSTVAYEIFEPA